MISNKISHSLSGVSVLLFILFLFACNKETQEKDITPGDNLLHDFIKKSEGNLSAYKYDLALLYADSALAIGNKQNDKQKIANALRCKGVAYRNKGVYDSARTMLFSAMSVCRKNKLTKTLGLVELSTGTYYLRLGKNDSAIHLGKMAIKHFKQSNDSSGIAMALNSLGSTLQQLGRRDEALQYYFGAEEIYESLGDVQRQAYVLNNIAVIYKFFEEYDKALELFKKCKSVSMEAGNQNMTLVSSMNIAGIYYFTDKTKKAEEAYLEAIELNREQPNNDILAAIYISLGAIYAELDKSEISYDYIIKAINLSKQTKNLRAETQANYKLAHYYLDKGNTTEAEKYFRKTINGAKQTGDIQHLSHSYKHLSAIQEENGDYKHALANFELSKELNDSIINEKKLEIVFDMESKYEKKKDEAEILRLSNENAKKEIQNSDLKIQLISVFSIVVLLIGIMLFIRLKNKKDSIITKQKIRQLEEEQKLLAAQSAIIGQENERKRIAQELHDGIGILLSTASIHFSNVEESSADKKTVQLLNKANKLLKQAGGEVRKISHDMMPGVLSKFGLQEALEDLFENVEDAGSIEVDYDIKLENERLDENTEMILYRVMQEILNNTLKHAHAKQIRFFLKQESNELTINYKDDGKGFDPDKLHGTKSLGLSGIKSRIDFLKGNMKLSSHPGGGVEYDIRISVQ